jgi:hypothetical protein
MGMSRIGLIFASWVMIVALSLVSAPVLAAIQLEIRIDTRNTPTAPPPASTTANGDTFTFKPLPAPPDSQASLEVTLADTFISIKSDTETKILDFRSKRKIGVDNISKTYVDYSLFAELGFRYLELGNRLGLQAAEIAMKLPMHGHDKLSNEHNLSILRDFTTKMDETVRSGQVIFSSGNRELARLENKGFKVTPLDSENFAKFLRYEFGGHPSILKKISAGTLIPGKLIFTFTEVGWTSIREISITSLAFVDSNSYDLSALSPRKAAPSSDELDAILDHVVGLPPSALDNAKENNRLALEKALRDDQIFEAWLVMLERWLMAGRPPSPSEVTPNQLKKLRANPSVLKLQRVVSPKTKEGFTESINELIALRSETQTMVHVLKVYEANNRLRLGQIESARKLFLEVLRERSLLASAYKDLSDLLFAQYDTPRAWRCLDIGRRLAPTFENFSEINKFEKILVDNYPEYF